METLHKKISGVSMKDIETASSSLVQVVREAFQACQVEVRRCDRDAFADLGPVFRTLIGAGALRSVELDFEGTKVEITVDYWQAGEDDVGVQLLRFLPRVPEKVCLTINVDGDEDFVAWLGLGNVHRLSTPRLDVSLSTMKSASSVEDVADQLEKNRSETEEENKEVGNG